MKETITQDNDVDEQKPSDHPVVPERASFLMACIETGLIVVGLFAIAWLLPHTMHGDGTIRLEGITELIEQHTWSNMPYSYIGPFFSIPFWLLGQHFHNILWWCEQYNLFVFTCGLLATFLLLRKHVEHGLLRKFFLILIAASMFANHLTTYYGEVFTAVLVAVGIVAAIVGRTASGRLSGWLAVILGVVNTPASLVGLGLVVLKHMLDNRKLRYVLVVLLAGAFIATEAWLRHGGPFVTGYENVAGDPTVMPFTGKPGFSYPFLFGLLSILFSFGKGLLFFAPGLLLPIRGTLLKAQQVWKVDLYRVYFLWICFLIGLILVYSRWWSWYGGWFWGPRFFLFASIPASFALAVRLHKRDASLPVNLLTAGILCLSAWVGLDGAIFDQSGLSHVCQSNNYALETLCHYTPDFSSLWHPFIMPHTFTQQQLLYMAYCGIVFLYLALPLAIKIIGQLVELSGSLGKTYLHLGAWKL